MLLNAALALRDKLEAFDVTQGHTGMNCYHVAL
jgi:hypothetical protein